MAIKIEGYTFAGPYYHTRRFIQDSPCVYILVNNLYRSTLPLMRQEDLNNTVFFKPVYSDFRTNIMIYEILDEYLNKGENLDGTFTQLEKIAPLDGTYFLDYPPNITENVFRILRFIFYNRNLYCDRRGAFFNSRIDIDLNNCKKGTAKYDFLLLGNTLDPKTFCNDCNAKLLWQGLGNGVKFWEVKQK